LVYIRRWEAYIPANKVVVDGKEVPALSKDEDEITVGYEVLSRFDNLRKYSHIFIADETKNLELHTIYELLDLDISPVIFKSFSEGFIYGLKQAPSLVTVIRTNPPAGSVTFEISEGDGRVAILKYLFKREFLGFLRTDLTDEKALNELISDASATSLSKVLSKLLRARKVKSDGLKIVSGFVNNPKIIDKALAKFKLKKADVSDAEELRKSGFKGGLGTALALSKALSKCSTQEKIVFVGGSASEGILTLYMQC